VTYLIFFLLCFSFSLSVLGHSQHSFQLFPSPSITHSRTVC
jgi:hypothetical protein